ncbi:magnesium and cobalt transport protein CorA [Dactylosporangium matsuzakiense]|uniref:Magnesium transport protein CorA n=1 Tax=Dactylosporangium matsuzakiense TaxID=53360 RepID=A0A9W6KTX1_9ACTN|nr:magnesium and cobalt transport protein CorA [Dactylosporangium matsuzakiense]UWZ41738.1 magnesium and cobalt transport protein CorA [Dactylosporangium matsuzakiense]GLL07147.1 magnesium transport protein CorA [Dactylosporangium matsuzakiense]
MNDTQVSAGRRVGRRVGRLLGRVISGLQPAEPLPQLLPRPEDDAAIMDCALYVRGSRAPGRPGFSDAYATARRRRNGFVWLGLFEPSWAQFTAIAQEVGADDATVDTTLDRERRPAIERRGDVTVLTLRTARYVEHGELTETSEVVDTGAVTLLIGAHFVVSVRHGGAGALADVREGLQQRPSLLAQGPWSVGYAVVERMVEVYHDVATRVERDVEKLEEVAFLRHGGCDVQQIYQLKRELVEFKRAVLPLQAPLRLMAETTSTLPPGLRQHFTDVLARLGQVVERVATYNELLDSILQARLAQVGLDQNNDMRKIAAWAAMAAVPTAIAGVYGMNFDHMPGTSSPWGFAVAVLVMCAGMLVLYRLFRKSKWL